MRVKVSAVQTDIRDKSHCEKIATIADELVTTILLKAEEAADCVNGVSVADQNTFGDAIQEFLPGESYTNDGYLTAFGKAIVVPASNPVQTHLILRIELVEWIADAIEKKKHPGMPLFAVAHEVGHAIDHRRRPGTAPAEALNDTNWLRRWRTLNSRVLIEEMAAQKFAAPFATDTVFAEMAQSFSETADQCLTQILTVKAQYIQKQVSIERLANVASEYGWRILIEYAKGRVIQRTIEPGTTPALEMSLPGWAPLRDDELQRIIDCADDAYPVVVQDIEEHLESVWLELVGMLGITFREQDRGFQLAAV